MKKDIKQKYKEAKKELFVAKTKSIIASTSLIVALNLPLLFGASVAGTLGHFYKNEKDESTKRNYLIAGLSTTLIAATACGIVWGNLEELTDKLEVREKAIDVEFNKIYVKSLKRRIKEEE